MKDKINYTNIIINSTAKYVPNNLIRNNKLIEHFNNRGLECEGLLQAFNRDVRYFADSQESSLTMAIEASKKILKKVDKDSIDMIVFISNTPEYTSPTNAIIIQHELELKNASREFDMNANCTGFLDAMYLISNLMKQDSNVNRTLIVGSEIFSTIVNYNDVPAFCNFADGACAMILDKITENYERGFIDSEFRNYTKDIYNLVFPNIGNSNILMNYNHSNDDKRLKWVPFDTGYVPKIWKEMIETVINRNDITEDKISGWCMSQLFPRENIQILTEMGYDLSKYIFVGDRYGYTGNTSPIFALDESNFLSKKGKHIIFNSIASGCHFVTLLYKI